ncbi:hypothetical protein [Bacillus wiedmannii]|uniref:hypothetical protein n=1 Tax=Bacillus wiedmannii TaxID=1890302 RepID=UPI0039FBCBBD
MMNSLRNLFAGNTKVKTIEAAQKEIDKLQAQENELQGQLSEAQAGHAKVGQALLIVEASLIIDETDKTALTSQEKAQAKLETLAKQVESTKGKLSEVSSRKQAVVQEMYRSRGEVARRHNIKIERDRYVVWGFNRAFNIEDYTFQLAVENESHMDLGMEYGLGSLEERDPQSPNWIAPHTEDWNFLAKLGQEDLAEGETQAIAIRKELQGAIKGVFDKHDIKLQAQTLNNLSRI